MKTAVLNRYEKDPQGRFVIDVSADGFEELYSFFDKGAPYARRDLDYELAEYLAESVAELEGHPFLIRFSLKRPIGSDDQSRIANSIQVYFHYLAEKERRQVGRMIRKSLLLFVLGLLILSGAVWFSQWSRSWDSVGANVVAQGFTVAAWVSLWESLATFLFEWSPRRRRIRQFRSLAESALDFRTQSEDGARALPVL